MVFALDPIPLLLIAAWLRRHCAPRVRSPFVLLPLAFAIHMALRCAVLFYGLGLAGLAQMWACR